jgi:hypothetical protein
MTPAPAAALPAAHDAWSILTQVLADRAWAWIIFGALTLLGVWFVGETGLAARARAGAAAISKRARRATATMPYVAGRDCKVGPQLSRGWLSALLLIGLVVAGVEVVRWIVNQERRSAVI